MDLSVTIDKLNSLDEAKLLIHELMALHQAEIESLKASIADLQQKQGLSSGIVPKPPQLIRRHSVANASSEQNQPVRKAHNPAILNTSAHYFQKIR